MAIQPVWPTASDFPQTPLEGTWRRQRGNNTNRFKPGVGPEQVRPRGLISTLRAQFLIILTEAQLPTLDAFHDVECMEGVKPFTFVNPETDVSETWSWATVPEIVHKEHDIYQVSVSLVRNY